MRRFSAVVLVLALLVGFIAGLTVTPTATAAAADEPVCWWAFCQGQQTVCCEGQVCCPSCAGDPPVCW